MKSTNPSTSITRRDFLNWTAAGTTGLALAPLSKVCGERSAAAGRPNVILCMSDDQGLGDVGYNGHPRLKTPALDAMSEAGIRFERFYSGSPVCSPTRGACLTGRHPDRYGIFNANVGHMPAREITLAEMLKPLGYRTGHFGKWHLGTLTKTVKEYRGGDAAQVEHYSPPWTNGFDTCFSTEVAVATWDPMVEARHDQHYWTGPDQYETDAASMRGDSSRVVMDRALAFIQQAAKSNTPFFAVIWLHSPHTPVVAGEPFLRMYEDVPEGRRAYYACLTALDQQIGRLRSELRRLGVADDTMLWFCSDNGPAGSAHPHGRANMHGSTIGLRGRKGSLYEGGIRVPALLEWPRMIDTPRSVDVPCTVTDYVPTVRAAVGLPPIDDRPIDGEDLMPLIRGRATRRDKPMGFHLHESQALINERYKLIRPHTKGRIMRQYGGYAARDLPADEATWKQLAPRGRGYELYDLLADPRETRNLAGEEPKVVAAMTREMEAMMASWQRSNQGADYKPSR